MGPNGCPLRIHLSFLMEEQKEWFLESVPGEDAVNIVGRTKKDLEYDTDLVDKAAGFERINSNFERSSTAGRMPSNSTASHREILRERKRLSTWQTPLLSCCEKSPQPPP